MANTYYHKHPRGFANECSIVVATTAAERAIAEKNDYERISAADLKKHIAHVNAENDSWGSNRAFADITWENMLQNGALGMADLIQYEAWDKEEGHV